MAREEVKKIQKSGNSLYVTIPKSYLTFLGLIRKDLVVVSLQRDHITVRPYSPENNKGEKWKSEK